MAEANLQITYDTYTLRANFLSLLISNLQDQKMLATYSQGDVTAIKAQDETAVRKFFKELYSDDPELREKYKDYTVIPDFEEEMDKIAAKFQDEMEQLSGWETQLDAEITTNSAELEEIKAYKQSIKSMLQSNISEDYNYGLNK